MTEVGVDGGTDDLTADLAELLCPVTEGHYLRWTDKGEVQGVEKEHQVLSYWGGSREHKNLELLKI